MFSGYFWTTAGAHRRHLSGWFSAQIVFFGGLSKFQKSKFQNFKISESENPKIKISKFRFENPRECQLNQSLTKFQRNRFTETPSRSSGVQVGEIRSRAPRNPLPGSPTSPVLPGSRASIFSWFSKSDKRCTHNYRRWPA